MSELAEEVRRRAGYRCEYCRLPQVAFRRSFHIEHIVARQHGGSKQLDNLALACWNCNLKKGPNLAGVDPGTGQTAALLSRGIIFQYLLEHSRRPVSRSKV